MVTLRSLNLKWKVKRQLPRCLLLWLLMLLSMLVLISVSTIFDPFESAMLINNSMDNANDRTYKAYSLYDHAHHNGSIIIHRFQYYTRMETEITHYFSNISENSYPRYSSDSFADERIIDTYSKKLEWLRDPDKIFLDRRYFRLKIKDGLFYYDSSLTSHPGSKVSGSRRYESIFAKYFQIFEQEYKGNQSSNMHGTLPDLDVGIKIGDSGDHLLDWTKNAVFGSEAYIKDDRTEVIPLLMISRSVAALIANHSYSKVSKVKKYQSSDEWIHHFKFDDWFNKQRRMVFRGAPLGFIRRQVTFALNLWELLDREKREQSQSSESVSDRCAKNTLIQQSYCSMFEGTVMMPGFFDVKLTVDPERSELISESQSNCTSEMCGFMKIKNEVNRESTTMKKMSIEEEMSFAYILVLDGVSVRDSLLRQLHYGSVVIYWQSELQEFWYSEMKDRVHWIVVRNRRQLIHVSEQLMRAEMGLPSEFSLSQLSRMAHRSRALVNRIMAERHVHSYVFHSLSLYHRFFFDHSPHSVNVDPNRDRLLSHYRG